MESNTKNTTAIVVEEQLMADWAAVLQALPGDLEESVVTYGALRRRRGVTSAEKLLRLAMGYSCLDKSLNEVGLWAVVQGIVDISAPSLYSRLCGMNAWLGRVLVQMMEQRRLQLPKGWAGNIEIRDATVISRPGSQGTDWRLHLKLDLGSLCISGVELTDAHGGETLVRFPAEPGRIVLADRIHATHNGVTTLLQQNAQFVIRMVWHNLPLVDGQQDWHAVDWLKQVFADPAVMFQEHHLALVTDQARYPVRVCAVRLPKEKAERAIQRARKAAQKKGHTPDERTLFAAQFVLVVTNLPAETWSPQHVLELYRLRWQVELYFKRLKSILYLDHLRARKPALAQTYLLTKLLAACLLDLLSHRVRQLLPDAFASLARPLNLTAFTSLLWDYFQAAVHGPVSLARMVLCLPRLQRFLCASTRKRLSLLVFAFPLFHPSGQPSMNAFPFLLS